MHEVQDRDHLNLFKITYNNNQAFVYLARKCIEKITQDHLLLSLFFMVLQMVMVISSYFYIFNVGSREH